MRRSERKSDLRWGRVVVCDDVFYPLGKHAKAVWFSLCLFARWDDGFVRGECWPSVATLSRVCGLGVTSVKSGLRALRDCGLVVCHSGRPGRDVNRYELFPFGAPSEATPSPHDPVAARPRRAAAPKEPQCAPLAAMARPPDGRAAATNITNDITLNLFPEQGKNPHGGVSRYEAVNRALLGDWLEADFHDR